VNLPKKSCGHYGCPNLTSGRYCDVHVQLTPTARQMGYSSAWDRYSKAFLAKHPWCVDPHKRHPHTRVQATITGHIKAFKGDRKLQWDHSNHIAVCRACNSYQAVKFEGGWGKTPALSNT
jgi:5-methylcytosine-specific restriction enzyme A